MSNSWINYLSHLKNNIRVAIVRLKTIENRLRRLDTEYVKKYPGETEDMVSREVARKLSVQGGLDYRVYFIIFTIIKY